MFVHRIFGVLRRSQTRQPYRHGRAVVITRFTHTFASPAQIANALCCTLKILAQPKTPPKNIHNNKKNKKQKKTTTNLSHNFVGFTVRTVHWELAIRIVCCIGICASLRACVSVCVVPLARPFILLVEWFAYMRDRVYCIA